MINGNILFKDGDSLSFVSVSRDKAMVDLPDLSQRPVGFESRHDRCQTPTLSRTAIADCAECTQNTKQGHDLLGIHLQSYSVQVKTYLDHQFRMHIRES